MFNNSLQKIVPSIG